MDAGWTRCTVLGCAREAAVHARVWIGGEQIATAWCLPHAASYRVDEVSA